MRNTMFNEEDCKTDDLNTVVGHLNEETRMVLPGIQAVFGFQLIAVFSDRFHLLPFVDQSLHFCALLCSAAAVMLVLIPAAYHRQAEPFSVSKFYCKLGNRILTFSLLPMAVGTSLDLYVIADMVLNNSTAATSFAAVSFVLFMTAWYAFPQYLKRLRKIENAAQGRAAEKSSIGAGSAKWAADPYVKNLLR